jgi:hypothetical protein
MRHHDDKSPPLAAVLTQVSPVHNFTLCFVNIYFNIFLVSATTTPQRFFYVPTRTVFAVLLPMHATCTAQSIPLDLVVLIILKDIKVVSLWMQRPPP